MHMHSTVQKLFLQPVDVKTRIEAEVLVRAAGAGGAISARDAGTHVQWTGRLAARGRDSGNGERCRCRVCTRNA